MSVRQWRPPLLWAAFILVVTSIPGADLPRVDFHASDKLVHATMYGIFAWLASRSLLRTGRPMRFVIMLVVVGIAAFGALDEWHQQFIPGRSMELFDWMADTSGAIIGAFTAVMALRVREGKEA